MSLGITHSMENISLGITEEIKCINCEKDGHYLKQCPDPIKSYGIILCSKNNRNELCYVNVRRRNTYGYFDFLRGNYDLLDPVYIQKIINTMTMQEKNSILNAKFVDLWKNLWLLKNNKVKNKRKSIFYKSMIKFNILKNGITDDDTGFFYNIKHFVKNSNTRYETPEWNFPKGKRDFKETPIESALREFEEETNILDRSKYTIDETKEFSIEHTGLNGVSYKTIYFLAFSDKQFNIAKERNRFQKQEISQIEWISHNNSLKLYRKYENYKVSLLMNIYNYLTK